MKILSILQRLPDKYIKIGLFVVILALGIYLRLYKVDQEFGYFGDQGRDLLVVRNWLTGGTIPLLGPNTSYGNSHLGPIYYYFLAPFLLLFNFQPISAVYFTFLAGVLTIALTFILMLKFANLKTAVVSALFIAISHVAIFLSRGSWNPNVQPFFFLLLLYLLLSALKNGKLKSIFGIYFIIGIGIQLHYTFFANLITSTLILFIFKSKLFKDYRFYATVLLGITIPLIPFIVGEYYRNFNDLLIFRTSVHRAIIVTDASSFLRSFLDRLLFPFVIYLSPNYLNFPLTNIAPLVYLIIISLSVLIAKAKGKLNFVVRILLIFLIADDLISMFMQINFYEHYYEEFAIVSLLLAATVTSYLIDKKKLRLLGILFMSVFIVWELYNLPSIYKTSVSPKLVYKTTDLITQYSKTEHINNLGIYIISPYTLHEGFEYRYLLERNGLITFSAPTIDQAKIVIIEGSSKAQIENTAKQINLDLKYIGDIDYISPDVTVPYATVYKL